MTQYSIDTAHSEIGFSVRHMMFAKVRGQFKRWTATIQYDDAAPAKTSLEVSVDVASIDTREEKRDAHLRSDDFFGAEKSPKMTFRSKYVEPAGAGRYKLVGDLTIRDTTREIALDVEQTGGGKDPWGNQRLGFTAKAAINRSEWGLKWNQALEAGGVLVSDKVEIEVEAQVVQVAG
jgi:polyisoprenoid-binding protein YceI